MRHSRILAVLAAGSLSVAAAMRLGAAADADASHSMAIAMHGLNGSGQDGTAMVQEIGGKVVVSVHLIGEPASASEPAHVHLGRCPVIKAIPAYNVGPVVGGKAESAVDLSWADITSGRYVLNVHESTEQLGRYVSCGDIGTSTTPMALPTDDNGGY